MEYGHNMAIVAFFHWLNAILTSQKPRLTTITCSKRRQILGEPQKIVNKNLCVSKFVFAFSCFVYNKLILERCYSKNKHTIPHF